MRRRNKSRRNPLKIKSGHELYTKQEVDEIVAELRRSLAPDDQIDLQVVEVSLDGDEPAPQPAASRTTGRSQYYAPGGRRGAETRKTPARGKKAYKTNNPEGPVSYPIGLRIGRALGGLNKYCPGSLRRPEQSHADALTAMGLNMGQAMKIVDVLENDETMSGLGSGARKKEFIREMFKEFNVSCPTE
jgi:hypothetical protein